METVKFKGAVNLAAFKLGLWAYRHPATRRAYIAAADAIGRRMRSLLGEDYKLYYYEGSVRRDILRTISDSPDLKSAVLFRTSLYDRERFRETGYIKPEIVQMIAEGSDLNLKTAILSRMSLRDCYQRFYDWNKTHGAKSAIIERRLWAFYLMNAFGSNYGSYEGLYKGIIYSDIILRVQLLVSALSRLPHRHKATEKNLQDVRTVVEEFELNLVLGNRTFDEWYGEFYREPSKYCEGNDLSPMLSIADHHLSKVVGNVGVAANTVEEAADVEEVADTVGILTRMIPKVVVQNLAHLSENEAKEKLFEPLNEYLRFLQWLPAPGRASSEEMDRAFSWVFMEPKRLWLFNREDTSDMGITMEEYAQAGLEKICVESGQIIS